MMKKYGGVLLICRKTGNFLLLERGPQAHFPNTWSIVSGGIDEGETPLEGIKRELKEETDIDDPNIQYKFFENQNNISPYFDFYLGYCDEEYECKLDNENTDWGWFNMDNLPSPLFPTLYSSLVRIF
tara:strand:- start:59 stop:439 length:381 start_codon:yes stop_codon:yes gene_type:complete